MLVLLLLLLLLVLVLALVLARVYPLQTCSRRPQATRALSCRGGWPWSCMGHSQHVDVAPVLQLCHNDWGDPDPLRALQSTITAADATHCRRTLQVLLVCMQLYVWIATMA